MLPQIFKEEPNQKYDININWETYQEGILPLYRGIDKYFITQICHDHRDKFNREFPNFDIETHKIVRITLSAEEIYNTVRDEVGKINYFYHLIDQYIDGKRCFSNQLLKDCWNNKTFPFPPVITDTLSGKNFGGRNLGSPFHLIEGNHRVSYINRMYKLGLIKGDSKHEFILLEV